MAATTVRPIDPLGSDGHRHERHENGLGHHAHSWKSITQRSPLQPASVNRGHPQVNPLKPQTYAYVAPSTLESFPVTIHDQSGLNLPLPPPNLTFTNANSRPKSMERRRSSVGLPTHLRLGGNGYGFPPTNTHRYVSLNDSVTRKWISPTEVISSVVVPLPYVLASLAFGAYRMRESLWLQFSVPDSVDKSTLMPNTNRQTRHLIGDGGLVSVCALTSATLLLMGCKGKIFGASKPPNRRKSSLGNRGSAATAQSGEGTLLVARRVIGRSLSVALPFYATLKLGGDRVALVMLVSLAADIIRMEDEITELKTIKGWRRLLAHRRWTLASILPQIFYDFAASSGYSAASQICLGYLALVLSVLFIPPPFPLHKPRSPTNSSSISTSASSVPKILATQWESGTVARPVSDLPSTLSPLVSTSRDVNLTLAAGFIVGALSCIMFLFSANNSNAVSSVDIGFACLSVCATALSFVLVEPRSIRQNRGLGLLLGSLLSLILMAIVRVDSWTSITFQGLFIGLSFTATMIDMNLPLSTSPRSEVYDHHHHTKNLHTTHRQASRFSNVLIQSFQHWPLLHSILVEKDSRRIFYFMSLNFAFMLVQTFYGIATGSLGLLSDSIHMFFDCLALVVGLCAAVMSKWPPSARFPYGYGKMDTLAGFANGIFLMLISIEIVYEAVERLAEGSEMQRIGELLTVSSLGLAVNLVGITAFGHAHHGHSHGGHEHSHASHGGHNHSGHNHSHFPHDGHNHSDHNHSHSSHDGHNDAIHDHQDHSHNQQHSHADHVNSDHSNPSHAGHNHNAAHNHHDHHDENHGSVHLHDHLHAHPTPSPIPTAPLQPVHSHSHDHKHHHDHHHHGNENMHGIYLHILADTLGSVAVVISTLLIHFYGWSGFDPLASCLIAILIFASAIPLVISSAKTLLLTIPEDTEFDLREALTGISGLRGVVGYAVPKFWLEEGDERKVLGVIHVVAAKGADMEDVKERALAFFRGRKMDVLVQVERDGSDRCWCRGGTKVAG